METKGVKAEAPLEDTLTLPMALVPQIAKPS